MLSRRTATYDGHQERGRMRAAAPWNVRGVYLFSEQRKTPVKHTAFPSERGAESGFNRQCMR